MKDELQSRDVRASAAQSASGKNPRKFLQV
jgi:hypothetical protein